MAEITPIFEETRNLHAAINRKMTKRFKAVEFVTQLSLATLLDPRFKKIYFTNPLAVSKYVNMLSSLVKEEAKGLLMVVDDSASEIVEQEVEHNKGIFAGHNKKVCTYRETDL